MKFCITSPTSFPLGNRSESCSQLHLELPLSPIHHSIKHITEHITPSSTYPCLSFAMGDRRPRQQPSHGSRQESEDISGIHGYSEISRDVDYLPSVPPDPRGRNSRAPPQQHTSTTAGSPYDIPSTSYLPPRQQESRSQSSRGPRQQYTQTTAARSSSSRDITGIIGYSSPAPRYDIVQERGKSSSGSPDPPQNTSGRVTGFITHSQLEGTPDESADERETKKTLDKKREREKQQKYNDKRYAAARKERAKIREKAEPGLNDRGLSTRVPRGGFVQNPPSHESDLEEEPEYQTQPKSHRGPPKKR